MKNLVFAFALLCSTSLVAQFSYNANGTGIESPYSTASGLDAFAVGWQTVASGSVSAAMCDRTIASGDSSTAMGRETQASGNFSTAMGNGTTASGWASTAMGYQTNAVGPASTAMGLVTTASGEASNAMGYETTASGTYSTAMGFRTKAQDFVTTAIGVNNSPNETPNPSYFSLENTAFVIGNGAQYIQENENDGYFMIAPEYSSNAFEVLFDGTTTIAGDLNINSDARLKANIISLGATLSKLLQIDGKTYTMKKDANHKKKIGLLAQDIEKVFPELVTETNDIKSVNYQGLVPVLINAMKEQQDEIDSYKTELTNQRKEIDELKTMVEQLISK